MKFLQVMSDLIMHKIMLESNYSKKMYAKSNMVRKNLPRDQGYVILIKNKLNLTKTDEIPR